MRIAVTGVTGGLGSRVARQLAAGAAGGGGPELVLLARDPARAAPLAAELGGARVERAEHGDGASVRRALVGADAVLMVSGAEDEHRVDQHRTFVDAAAAAGVGHLVYTSFLRASARSTFTLGRDHAATEDHLRASGLVHTVLRDALYADSLPLLAGDDGVIRGPAGAGRVAAVARDDVADVATAVLRSPGEHAGATYELTGPADLGLHEVAAAITAATGREVRYHEETVDEAYASRASTGAPRWLLDAWVSTYTAVAAGEMAGVTSAVEDLTGHPATSLAQLLAR